ncbi:nucleoside diphosphate kinase homolog 5-like [Leptopilina boulardi]|uniref:nucleoside diphosphate kinase homolog 5-like n=1 Tax=Leptopilina boulardi TaxID=63433 RepID=UPI0021F577B5|nr:nucleoside diphosphate kinase homolog 5-like [Leptopilina boulardi]
MSDDSEEIEKLKSLENESFEKCMEDTMENDILEKKIVVCKDRISQSEPSLIYYNTNDPQSSSSGSSTSTNTYKCVDPIENYFMRNEEEEDEQSRIICEPCVLDEKDEELEEIPDVECTLAIIKPDAVNYRKDIERRIYEEDFEVYQARWLQLSPEQASEFYSDSYGQINFAHLVAYMSSGPIVAMVLAKHQAVHEWRMLMGPKEVTQAQLYFPDSIRAQFGKNDDEFQNAVHGSSNREEAEKEIHFFFPEFIVEPILKGQMAVDYLWEVINSVLVEGLSECCKVKPEDPILWLANWLLTNNPYKPKMSTELMMIPT